MASEFKALILDLGGVLVDWDPKSVTAVSSTQLRLMMHSAVWHDLDRGTVTLDQACEQFDAMTGVDASIIKESLDQAQSSLVVDKKMTEFIQELKRVDPELKLYVMSNISKEHLSTVLKLDLPWSIFDHVFGSGHVGMRKPDLCFFEHVIDTIGLDPSEMVMLDDQAENICAARSLGIQGFVVDKGTIQTTRQTAWNLFQKTIPRAQLYLKANAGMHHCTVEGYDVVLKDNFSQLLIWGLSQDYEIIYLKWPSGKIYPGASGVLETPSIPTEKPNRDNVQNGLWNYFCENPILTTQDFPPDADTTSIAYMSLPEDFLHEVADVNLVLDKMSLNLSPDGIMQTYFCDDRPRTAPEVCSNMLRVFHRFGRGDDPAIKKTEDWVVRCLTNRACLYGNRVYSTPESFLYFTARLYLECGECPLRKRLEPIRQALLERVNVPVNPLALALRVLACQLIGLDRFTYQRDFRELMSMQQEDGGFPAGHFCCIGRTGARIGNRGLTTALAMNAARHEQYAA